MPPPDPGWSSEKPIAAHYGMGSSIYVGGPGMATITETNGAVYYGYNAYYDAANAVWKYIITGTAAALLGFQVGATTTFSSLWAASGTADGTITWTIMSAGQTIGSFLSQTATATTGVTTTETVITGLADTGTGCKMTGFNRYKINASVRAQSTVAADKIAFRLRDGGTSAPTSASTLIGEKIVNADSASVMQDYDMTFYTPLTTTFSAGNHRLGLFVVRSAGTGTLSTSVAATTPSILQVEIA